MRREALPLSTRCCNTSEGCHINQIIIIIIIITIITIIIITVIITIITITI